MLEKLSPILRLVCAALVALVIYQAFRVAFPKTRALGDFTPAGAELASKANSTNSNSQMPPEVTAQIDKIKDSQILGQIMRPPPMAVIGIAGKDVIFRAPNGQTGLLREGEELGGVKLLKIGINRILVEENNQQKELTLFQGFGGESLLPKQEHTKPSESPK
jgi:hypothetical protein